MTQLIEINEDAFALLFKPIENELRSRAAFDWGTGFGTLFETFGAELYFVLHQDRTRIWTLVSGDGGEYITSGCRLVNRLGYFVTEVPVPDGVTVQVPLSDSDSDINYPPKRIKVALDAIVEYLWKPEERHYLESEPEHRHNHIFKSVCKLQRWLNRLDCSTRL